MEQFFLLDHFGMNASLFYCVNAIEVTLLFYFLIKIVKLSSTSEKEFRFNRWLPFLALLTPGLVMAYFRLLVPERLLVLCLSVLVTLDLEGMRGLKRKAEYALIAIVAMFLKEPAFLIIGGMSFFKILKKQNRAFHALMMALGVGFIFTYCLATHAHFGGEHYGSSHGSKLATLAKNFFNFSLNDSFVVFFAIPLWCYLLGVKKTLDPYLTLIVGYFAVFMVLGIYQEYYLLPLLPFLLVAWIQNKVSFPKPVKVILALLLLNSVMGGLNQLSVYKNEPYGFSEVIHHLSSQPGYTGQRVCYLGVNEEFSTEILVATQKYLTAIKPGTIAPEVAAIHDAGISAAQPCHFWIDSPYNYDQMPVPANLKQVYHFEPVVSIPPFTLKTLVKWLVSRAKPDALKNKNIFRNHEFGLYEKLSENSH
jgi:hypothetical protein